MAQSTAASGHDNKVIEMDRFRSGKSLSPLRQIEAYWTALRCEGDVPKRSQIDPRGLEQMLKYAFVLERIAPGVARFRIAGHHLMELAGLEVRGMPFTALFDASARNQVSAGLEQVFDGPSIQELRISTGTGLEARAVLLPLRSETGAVSRAIGAIVCDGPIATGTHAFRLDSCTLRPVSGQPAPMRFAPARPEAAPQPSGFAEPAAAFEERPVTPHLRLVKTDAGG